MAPYTAPEVIHAGRHFTGYQARISAAAGQFQRRADHQEWLANALSITLVTSGAALGLTALVHELSVALNALLGFVIVIAEGAVRIFRPSLHATYARRAAHELDHEIRLMDVGAIEPCEFVAAAEQTITQEQAHEDALENPYKKDDPPPAQGTNPNAGSDWAFAS